MNITYRKLRELIIERRIKWQEIHDKVDISWGTIAKINKDEPITLNTLAKIAEYLHVDIGDIVEIKKG